MDVDAYPTEKGTDVNCGALIADVPASVDGQARREVSHQVAAAWGEPAIILRCGVERPESLTASSPCFPVRDVGWLAEKQADGYLFTTIGRTFFVSVEVPADYDPAADALADLAASITKHDPQEQPCV